MPSDRLSAFVAELKKATEAADVGGWISDPRGDLTGQPPITAKMVEIIKLLQAELLMVDPCLTWCKTKLAEIAKAKLLTLYTPEQVEAMMAEAKKQV